MMARRRGLQKVYTGRNVYVAACERVREAYREADGQVVVGFSGGKDSTVIFNLAIDAATEMGRLPVRVLFIDQEGEWQATADYMRRVMHRPDVDPMWLQIPMQLFNASSHTDHWLHCWEPGKKWMRDKDEVAITENVFGTRDFKGLFPAAVKWKFPKGDICLLGGMRCEESHMRTMGIMQNGYRQPDGKRFVRYVPIYDWSYSDVWKAIHDNEWDYNTVYDRFHQFGLSARNMRVSNLHHAEAINSLWQIQEIEPDTWDRLVERLPGIHSMAHSAKSEIMLCPERLPEAFKDWIEYRDYLIENLCTPDVKEKFRKGFASYEKNLRGAPTKQRIEFYRSQITCVLRNDYHLVTIRDAKLGLSNYTTRKNVTSSDIKLAVGGSKSFKSQRLQPQSR